MHCWRRLLCCHVLLVVLLLLPDCLVVQYGLQFGYLVRCETNSAVLAEQLLHVIVEVRLLVLSLLSLLLVVLRYWHLSLTCHYTAVRCTQRAGVRRGRGARGAGLALFGRVGCAE